MIKNIDILLSDIKNYYSNKIKLYGPTPNGVDWKNEESQIKRFDQLLLVLNYAKSSFFTINDIGCGYGKLFEYIKIKNLNFNYLGYDLSTDMIKYATDLYGHEGNCQFFVINSLDEIKKSDFTVASGIFNVKMTYDESDWLYYILKTLDIINLKSSIGFSFNILTKYSDKEFMRNDLYYADPLFLFDYCKRNYSKNISLIHDYDLFEFTILVKK